MLSAMPAGAQQGAIHVSAAVQGVTGDPQRLAGENRLEPDFGVSWIQPGSRFGLFQLEVRGTRRGQELHAGRTYLAIRDLKYRGIAWTIEGGDAYFSPSIGDYKFSNLFTPTVTFSGGAITGRTPRSTLTVVAGRTTAWRNIFGSDPDALGQTIGSVRAVHRPTLRLDVNLRGSRIRTSNLKEFSYTIDSSDQAGGGATFRLTPAIQLVADGSVVSYRRTGLAEYERDGSVMAGGSWLHSRGWLQVNASRFSPGDFPALNNPLQDREGVFAAGDYQVWSRLRLAAGFDAFRSNLNPDRSKASSRPVPPSSGLREFGSVRLHLTTRSTFTLRAEQGDRRTRPLGFGLGSDSDTGSWAAEWQAAIGRTNTFARYSRRDNVDHVNRDSSYTQHDMSAQFFVNLTRTAQLFGTAALTETGSGAAGGNTYWQAGGGAQLQVSGRGLWLRAEGTAARNVDLLTQSFVPRESASVGLNGQLSRNVAVAFNMNVDRSPMPFFTGSPWTTRSMLRVIHTRPTGSVYSANTAAVGAVTSGRGTGTVSGMVYVDWNANGLRDAGEDPLEDVPLRIASGGTANTARDGQFAFLSVPVGVREVSLDPALPIDFDPPEIARVQVELSRGDTKRVSFGLIPLGSIHGRVTRDANGNGKADPGEETIEGILILDGGARSERTRSGRYRFDSVRSGDHLVKLLGESLPEGAVITGDAEVKVALTRDRLTSEATFLVSVEKRPEIRKVFPPRRGGAAPSTAGRPGTSSGSRIPPARPGAAPARVKGGAPRLPAPALTPDDGPSASVMTAMPVTSRFAVQIAALNDSQRARDLVRELKTSGLPAYLVQPGAADPNAPYRIRVGPYRTRAAAQKTVTTLEKERGEKLWVIRENKKIE